MVYFWPQVSPTCVCRALNSRKQRIPGHSNEASACKQHTREQNASADASWRALRPLSYRKKITSLSSKERAHTQTHAQRTENQKVPANSKSFPLDPNRLRLCFGNQNDQVPLSGTSAARRCLEPGAGLVIQYSK